MVRAFRESGEWEGPCVWVSSLQNLMSPEAIAVCVLALYWLARIAAQNQDVARAEC